jgi:hypothetical protein
LKFGNLVHHLVHHQTENNQQKIGNLQKFSKFLKNQKISKLHLKKSAKPWKSVEKCTTYSQLHDSPIHRKFFKNSDKQNMSWSKLKKRIF